MSVTLNNFTWKMDVNIESEKAQSEISKTTDRINKIYQSVLSAGSGADQADELWSDSRSIAASGNDDIDLAGSLTNAFGDTITFAEVKGVFVYNSSPNAASILTVGASGGSWPANPWQANCGPNGMFVQFEPESGETVTATTADTLRITNQDGTNTATYDIIIVGVST